MSITQMVFDIYANTYGPLREVAADRREDLDSDDRHQHRLKQASHKRRGDLH